MDIFQVNTVLGLIAAPNQLEFIPKVRYMVQSYIAMLESNDNISKLRYMAIYIGVSEMPRFYKVYKNICKNI